MVHRKFLAMSILVSFTVYSQQSPDQFSYPLDPKKQEVFEYAKAAALGFYSASGQDVPQSIDWAVWSGSGVTRGESAGRTGVVTTVFGPAVQSGLCEWLMCPPLPWPSVLVAGVAVHEIKHVIQGGSSPILLTPQPFGSHASFAFIACINDLLLSIIELMAIICESSYYEQNGGVVLSPTVPFTTDYSELIAGLSKSLAEASLQCVNTANMAIDCLKNLTPSLGLISAEGDNPTLDDVLEEYGDDHHDALGEFIEDLGGQVEDLSSQAVMAFVNGVGGV